MNRRLTEEEIAFLVREIKKTPMIAGFSAREWRKFDEIFVAEVNGKIAGTIVLTRLFFGWMRITAFFVLEKYRNKGIGSKLFDAAYDLIVKNKNRAYVASYDIAVIHKMQQKDMWLTDNFFELPFIVGCFNIGFVMHPYRIYEFFRKEIELKSVKRLIYGVKDEV